MKKLFFISVLFICLSTKAQKVENIIIVTTDGFRWQEVFNGLDSAIANNKKYNEGDSAYLFKKFWSDDVNERRKKLLPFFWNSIATQGQLYGNRNAGCKVNVFNPYQFSYPGYSEIFTGFVDTAINSNSYKANPHTNVLAFLNKQNQFKNKVAAFGAWDAFDRILNEEKSGFTVTNAFEKFGGTNPSIKEKLLNEMLENSYKPFKEDECLDVFTHYGAMEYLKNKKPKVLYISYGETDEWAHATKYRSYVEAAHQVDTWLNEIWNYVQSDPQYKNKTALFITTDHGRGDIKKDEWQTHGQKIADAGQIWFAVLSPVTSAKGEIKENIQLYQQQFAQTIAALLGYTFTCEHEVAKPIDNVLH